MAETPDEQKETPPPKKEKTDWHRIASGLFAHTFEEPSFDIKVDFDVATTEKMVDIVVRKMKDDLPSVPLLSKGVEELKEHNLFTFKSYQEPFDHEAIEELIAYFNLYLKTKAPSGKNELDRSLVCLFAICVRKPIALLKNPKIPAIEITHGVYDVEYGMTPFRLIVVNELELSDKNANLLLFSNLKERVQYGKQHHSLGQTRYTGLMKQLLTRYEKEGDQAMVDILSILNPTEEEVFEDLAETPRTRKKLIKIFRKKEYIGEFLEEVPVEQRLEGIPTEKRLEGVSADDVLKGLSPNQLAELIKKIKNTPDDPPS